MCDEDPNLDNRLEYILLQLQLNFKNVPSEKFDAFSSSDTTLALLYDLLDSDLSALFFTEATRGMLNVSKVAPGGVKTGQSYVYVIKLEVS